MSMWHMVELGWASLGSIVSQVWLNHQFPTNDAGLSPAQAPWIPGHYIRKKTNLDALTSVLSEEAAPSK